MHISIHAPARGATCVTPSAFTISADFNPRSREGSDAIRQGHREPFSYFNPRSREGSDLPPWILLYSSKISIHAPARGATSPVAMTARSIVFQSTLPRGERLCSCRSATLLEDFNPRSREGSDNYGYQIAHRL